MKETLIETHPTLLEAESVPSRQQRTYPKVVFADPFFSFVNPVLALANTRGFIDNCDLYHLPPQYQADTLLERYMELYGELKSVMWPLSKVLGTMGVVMIVLTLVSTLLQYADPLILKYMIKFISDPSQDATNSVYTLAAVGLVLLLLRNLCSQHATHITYLCNIKCINCVFGLLYQKTLRMSSAARALLGTGKIMNILHGDGKMVSNCVYGFNDLWTTPIEIVATLVLLYREIRWYAFIGATIIILGMGIQRFVYYKYTTIRRKMYKYMDGRSKYLNEYLEGVKIIKFNAWEDFAYENIKSARESEASLQFKAEMLKVVNEIMIPLLMILTILLIYLWEGHALTPEQTFTVLALYKKLESPLRKISSIFNWYAKFRLSLHRVHLFMQTPEGPRTSIEYRSPSISGRTGEVTLKGCSYAWVDKGAIEHAEQLHNLLKKGKTGEAKSMTSALANFSTQPCLHDVNLHIRKGELVAIVGEVGSGKSALLQGIIGELIRCQGESEVTGTVRYVSQVPWIIDSTMEHNICLSRPGERNEATYNSVFADCDLDVDARQFVEYDQVEIGARGANLSGGQRARVGIAREIYADGDVFLFDDCLSALDPQVAAKIFNNVILKGLQNKTRVFVTHAFHLASLVPRIIVLKEGRIVEEGSYSELISKNGEFARLQSGQKTAGIYEPKAEKTKKMKKLKKLKEMSPESSPGASARNDAVFSSHEAKATGSISWKYYLQLITYGGLFRSVCALVVFFAVDIIMAIIQWWLAMWTMDRFGRTMWFYTAFYLGISLLYCVAIFVRKLLIASFQYYISLQSQIKLVETLLHTPVSWFDYNPVGRIVNRAVKDQSMVDSLGIALANAVQKAVSLVVTFFVIGLITPYFLVLLAALVVLYVYWYSYSIQAARDARRLNSINHSPMYNLFNEILDGLVNIRLAGLEEVFMGRQHAYLDASARSFIFKAYCSRWINLRIETLGAFAVAGASMFLAFDKGHVLGALAGFSLLNSISIASKLGSMLLSATEVETNMSSMERICEYIDYNPQERPYDSPEPQFAPWPSKGRLAVRGLSVRYQAASRLVLSEVGFIAEPGQKIGVVGRTGSGKSTLTMALLRVLEPVHTGEDNGGNCILIDGVDVENVGLKYLRSAIGIIGQDPVLFSGTVRSNLDPFRLHTDDEIMQALEKVTMFPLLRKKLEEQQQMEARELELRMREYKDRDVMNLGVRERGENFSVGERQLLSLARALIKRPKILIMDEATASVDEGTDWHIHEMLRTEFKDTTVLIIAHRVKTILECDKILVLDEGKVVDFDAPQALINRKAGFFYDSLQQSFASVPN